VQDFDGVIPGPDFAQDAESPSDFAGDADTSANIEQGDPEQDQDVA